MSDSKRSLEDFGETSHHVLVVMEVCRGGDVFGLLRRAAALRERETCTPAVASRGVPRYFHRCRLHPTLARELLRQLLQALAYLHEGGVMHRDLKLSNVLLRQPVCDDVILHGGALETVDAVLADFGLASQLPAVPADTQLGAIVPGEGQAGVARPGLGAAEAAREHYTVCGTPQYTAPEVSRPARGSPHTTAVDVFSAGCLLYTMLFGVSPLEKGGSPARAASRLRRGGDGDSREGDVAAASGLRADFEASLSCLCPDGRDILLRMLALVPADRPTASATLQHAFFKCAPAAILQEGPVPASASGSRQEPYLAAARARRAARMRMPDRAQATRAADAVGMPPALLPTLPRKQIDGSGSVTFESTASALLLHPGADQEQDRIACGSSGRSDFELHSVPAAEAPTPALLPDDFRQHGTSRADEPESGSLMSLDRGPSQSFQQEAPDSYAGIGHRTLRSRTSSELDRRFTNARKNTQFASAKAHLSPYMSRHVDQSKPEAMVLSGGLADVSIPSLDVDIEIPVAYEPSVLYEQDEGPQNPTLRISSSILQRQRQRQQQQQQQQRLKRTHQLLGIENKARAFGETTPSDHRDVHLQAGGSSRGEGTNFPGEKVQRESSRRPGPEAVRTQLESSSRGSADLAGAGVGAAGLHIVSAHTGASQSGRDPEPADQLSTVSGAVGDENAKIESDCIPKVRGNVAGTKQDLLRQLDPSATQSDRSDFARCRAQKHGVDPRQKGRATVAAEKRACPTRAPAQGPIEAAAQAANRWQVEETVEEASAKATRDHRASLAAWRSGKGRLDDTASGACCTAQEVLRASAAAAGGAQTSYSNGSAGRLTSAASGRTAAGLSAGFSWLAGDSSEDDEGQLTMDTADCLDQSTRSFHKDGTVPDRESSLSAVEHSLPVSMAQGATATCTRQPFAMGEEPHMRKGQQPLIPVNVSHLGPADFKTRTTRIRSVPGTGLFVKSRKCRAAVMVLPWHETRDDSVTKKVSVPIAFVRYYDCSAAGGLQSAGRSKFSSPVGPHELPPICRRLYRVGSEFARASLGRRTLLQVEDTMGTSCTWMCDGPLPTTVLAVGPKGSQWTIALPAVRLDDDSHSQPAAGSGAGPIRAVLMRPDGARLRLRSMADPARGSTVATWNDFMSLPLWSATSHSRTRKSFRLEEAPLAVQRLAASAVLLQSLDGDADSLGAEAKRQLVQPEVRRQLLARDSELSDSTATEGLGTEAKEDRAPARNSVAVNDASRSPNGDLQFSFSDGRRLFVSPSKRKVMLEEQAAPRIASGKAEERRLVYDVPHPARGQLRGSLPDPVMQRLQVAREFLRQRNAVVVKT